MRALCPMVCGTLFAVSLHQCAMENNPAAPVYEILGDEVYVVSLSTPSSFTEGNMGVITPDRAKTSQNLLKFSSSDNIIRTFNGDVYVLERTNDNLVKIPGSSLPNSVGLNTLSYPKQHLGNGVNIQDIAFSSATKAYVTELSTPFLLVVDPSTGFKLDSVDLSRFNTFSSNPDSSPEPVPYMSPLAIASSKLYVGCQRLKNFTPVDTSLVVAISTSADTIIKAIPLQYRNPYAMAVFGTKIYVASPGLFGDPGDGGLEVIESTKDSVWVVVTDLQVGGSISGVVIISETKGYISVHKNNTNNDYWVEILPFDPQTGQVGSKIEGINNAFGGTSASSKYLYVGDRGLANPGVFAVDLQGDTVVAGPYDIGMPPNGMVVVPR